MRYEIATLTIRLGTLGKVVEGIDAFVKDKDARGTLLGCWFTEIGDLNKVILFRSFAEHADLATERMRVLSSTNPFNAGEAIADMQFESYAPFPWLGEVQPGAFGGVYEIRTYKLKHGGVLDGQQKAPFLVYRQLRRIDNVRRDRLATRQLHAERCAARLLSSISLIPLRNHVRKR